jgi:hypothetical protein
MGKVIAPDSWPDIALNALKRAVPKRVAVGYISSPGPDFGKVVQITLCRNDAEKEYDHWSDKIEIRPSPATAPNRPRKTQAKAYMEELLSALEKAPVDRVLISAKILCRISSGKYIIRLFNQFFRIAASPIQRRYFDLAPFKRYDWFAVYDKDVPELSDVLEKLSHTEALANMLKST